MSARDQLRQIVDALPDSRVGALLAYANVLSQQVEHADWQAFGLRHLATAYGDDEPEYSEADIKSRLVS